jgi:hypothetical protein
MSFLSPKVSTPKVSAAPPPPDRTDAEVQQLADSQRARFYGARGASSTQLSSGAGTAGRYSSAAQLLGMVGKQ